MKKTRVFVAGHNGMVGSALVDFLKKQKGIEIITKNRKDLNLTNQLEVLNFFESSTPISLDLSVEPSLIKIISFLNS